METSPSEAQCGRKALLTKSVKCVVKAIFPNAGEEDINILLEKSFSTRADTDNLEAAMIEAFTQTKDKKVRQYIVMQLSVVHSMAELTELLPGLTKHQVKEARKMVSSSGLTALPPDAYVGVKRNRLGMKHKH